MAYAYASDSFIKNERSRREVTIAADTTVEGDSVVWVSTVAGADITLARWDSSRPGEFIDPLNPLIVVKSTADTTGVNTLVKSEDGTTLYTFAVDNSVTAGFAAFRLVTGTMEVASWRLA